MIPTIVNKRNLSGSYVYDASLSGCRHQRMTREHYHPSSQIQMYNKLYYRKFEYIEISDLPCFMDNIGDDVLVTILLFCDVSSFISFSQTCKHYNKVTKIKENTNIKNNRNKNNNYKRINYYWYNYCKQIYACFKKSTNKILTYNCETYNYNSMYQKLFNDVTDSIIEKYKFELARKVRRIFALANRGVVRMYFDEPENYYAWADDEIFHETSLMVALQHKQCKIVKLLIPLVFKAVLSWPVSETLHRALYSAGVGNTNKSQQTNMYSCSAPYADVAIFLIDNGCDINITDNYNKSALYVACRYLQFDVIKKLIQHPLIKDNIDTCHKDNHFGLFETIKRGQFEDCKNLIEFIIYVGVKTDNEKLKNIIQVRSKKDKTVLDMIMAVECSNWSLWNLFSILVLFYFALLFGCCTCCLFCECRKNYATMGYKNSVKWVKYLCSKGFRSVCTTSQVKSTLLTDLMKMYDIEAMICLLKCGFQNIYHKEAQFNLFDKHLTPLESLCIRVKNEFHRGDYDNKNMKVFIYLVDYILTNMKQFGGETKVLNHIINTGAAQIILDCDDEDLIPIQDHLVELTKITMLILWLIITAIFKSFLLCKYYFCT